MWWARWDKAAHPNSLLPEPLHDCGKQDYRRRWRGPVANFASLDLDSEWGKALANLAFIKHI
jgi:hypothetical protein